MRHTRQLQTCSISSLLLTATLGVAPLHGGQLPASTPPPPAATTPTGAPAANITAREAEVDGATLLKGEVQPIDLGTALRLAGVQNPRLLLARARVLEAVAVRQLAAAQIIPTLNGGGGYDQHTGNLQQSNGNILAVNRSSVYVGAGAFATAAGPPAIPGVVLAGNAGQMLFLYLESRQVVRQREFANAAETNQILLRVAEAYAELIRAEARRAIGEQIRDQSREVARITAAYARTGEGRPADADRAATELARRRADLRRFEGDILRASAYLCRLLNLDPSIRLKPTDAYAVPMTIVPDPIPLPELVAVALARRPEMGERGAVVREALLALRGAKLLPFSPTILLAFDAGGFGGGSNLVSPGFGNFGSRADFDAVAYWSLRNFGVGNAALINIARAHLQASEFERLIVLDRIRDEVAEAYAKTHARFAQIGEEEEAVRSAIEGFALDLSRIRQAVPREEGNSPRPIEVLDSLKLLRESKLDYLDAIVDYNRAHFELYVAMGQPPIDVFAHPVPPDGVPPGAPAAGAPPFAAPPPPQPGVGPPFGPSGVMREGRSR